MSKDRKSRYISYHVLGYNALAALDDTIGKLKTKSEIGMAATYHSVISTVKMQGKSAWAFLGKFFTNIFNGCRDYSSLSLGNISLALCQY